MKLSLAIALCGLAIAAPAFAEAPGASTLVATLVVVQTLPGVTRARIEEGFVKAVPTYQKVPGLLRKYFTVNDTGFGGMYLWKDRASAEAWYSPAWRARGKAAYGVEPQVTYFDSPVQIDNTGGGGR